MTTHDAFIELAAVAFDFPLPPADRARLEQHLAGCAACIRTTAGMRGDAAALAWLPPVVLPERRGAEILDRALHPAAVGHPVRLLLAAALLGLLLIGSLAAGAQLLQRQDEQLSVVPPLPSASPTDAPASPGASVAPSTEPAGPSGRLAVTDRVGEADRVEVFTMSGATTPLGAGHDPAWLSEDRVVYACPASGDHAAGICIVGIDGANGRLLVADGDRPAPAPGGATIAFHRGTIGVGETWVMAADGTGPRLLRSGAFLRWSPDGAWLAGQPESAVAQVSIVGADGAGFRVLATGYDPAWSPSGDRIAFGVVDGGVATLRTVNVASGATQVLVTAPAGVEIGMPAWLPDGRLVFVQGGALWLFDTAAPAPAKLADGVAPASVSTDPPAVSPDGAWVAYADASGVAVVAVTGDHSTTVPSEGRATQPRWEPVATPSAPMATPSAPVPGRVSRG